MPVSKVKIDYAPIIVFAYNRADCLENLLMSLEQNDKTEDMELFIFIDIPLLNDKKNIERNVEVINFVDDYKNRSKKFKKIQVIVAQKHKGLAKSIITGVSKVINEYGKAIVLEDDLIVSNDFLDYMQRGLNFYEDNEKVWAVAAHTFAMKELKYYRKDVFLAPRPESWGWGTWKDRWNRTDWAVKTYERFKKDYVGQFLFNLGGNDLCKMLDLQMEDEAFESWAIRWGYQQFLERKFTVYPKESRVIHCGNDDRSTHAPFCSAQPLKKDYKKCIFENIKVNYILLLGFRRVNSERGWVIKMIIKHYYDFGTRMNQMIGKELSKSAWELLRTDGKDQAFSFTEQDISTYEEMCYGRKDYRKAARIILGMLKRYNIKDGIVSIGCGKGILEWNLKNLKPELHVTCTDYTGGNLKYLKRLFPQCDAFYRMDMRNAKHYSKIAKKNQIVLFYRISTELDYRAWKDVFYKMYQEGIQYVIWVPTELGTVQMALDYYKKAIEDFIKKKDKSGSVFCGYIYSKRTQEKMWKPYFKVKDEVELKDTMIFLLERHYADKG